MASSRKRGGGGFLGTIVWAFLILSLVFAWFKTPVPADTSIMDFAKAKSNSVEAWVKSFSDTGFDFSKFFEGSKGLPNFNGKPNASGSGDTGSNGNTGSGWGGNPTPVSTADSLKVLDTLKVAPAEKVSYDRSEWSHWASAGASCWDTREAVLLAEAKPGTAKLFDKNGKETTNASAACSITGGEWVGAYSGKTFTDPKKLDIDHMIPLSYAAQHGGQAWDSAKKKDYANNLKFADHLIAVDAGQNRSKSDKGPSQWKPSDKGYYCTYAKNWVTISNTWGLSTTEADKKALQEMLGTCK